MSFCYCKNIYMLYVENLKSKQSKRGNNLYEYYFYAQMWDFEGKYILL